MSILSFRVETGKKKFKRVTKVIKKEQEIKYQREYQKMALNKSETSLNMDLESKQKIVLLKVKNRSRKS